MAIQPADALITVMAHLVTADPPRLRGLGVRSVTFHDVGEATVELVEPLTLRDAGGGAVEPTADVILLQLIESVGFAQVQITSATQLRINTRSLAGELQE